MEKDILVENLKSKLGEDTASVISNKTFDGIAGIYLSQFANDEAITDETWSQPLAVLREYAGQKRHDDKVFAEKYKKDYTSEHEKDVEERIRKAKEDAIEEYKKSIKPDDKAVERNADDIESKINAAVEAAILQLTKEDGIIGKSMKEISDFTKDFKAREKASVENNVRKELTSYLKSRKADKEAVIDLTVGQIKIGETPNIAELKVLAEKNYESNYKRFYGDGGQPFGGNSSGGTGGGVSFVKEKLDKLSAEATENMNYSSDLAKSFV